MVVERPLVVFVVGPTASGKSDFAVEAALRFGGEILNTDSVQIFASVDIGTAKPSEAERKGVPHHLLGVVPEGEPCTAGDFRRRALEVITHGAARGQMLFFAVGGSGFYIQALEKGMYPVPEVPDFIHETMLRDGERLAEDPGHRERLHAELASRDPESAREISPNDTYRLLRALEINRTLQAEIQGSASGTMSNARDRTWSGIRRRFEEAGGEARPFDVLKIGLERERTVLRTSVESRVRRMLDRGLIEEVRALRARGLGAWAPMASVGYKETQDHLDGQLSRAALEDAIVTHTMQLAKRQMTWFRRDSGVTWFRADEGWERPLAWLDTQLAAHKDGNL